MAGAKDTGSNVMTLSTAVRVSAWVFFYGKQLIRSASHIDANVRSVGSRL